MLNLPTLVDDLGVKVSVDVKQTHAPIWFDHVNECVHCGSKNSLIFVDFWGRESKNEIKAFDHIKCKVCGKPYSIYWQNEEGSSNMYPSAVDRTVKQEFVNFINRNDIKENGVKEIN